VTIGILQYLALENLRDANELMNRYKMVVELIDTIYPDSRFVQYIERSGSTAKSELYSFLDYLLRTATRDAYPLFQVDK
jgi:hypothetical protein